MCGYEDLTIYIPSYIDTCIKIVMLIIYATLFRDYILKEVNNKLQLFGFLKG